MRENIQAVLNQQKGHFVFRHQRAKNDLRDVEVFSHAIVYQGRTVLHSAIVDVTERNQAREKLLAALDELNKLSFIVNNSPAVAFVWQNQDNWPIAYVSKNVSAFGYSHGELLSGEVQFNQIVHPCDLERVQQEVLHFSEIGAESFTQEYRLITREGRVVWVDDRTWIVRDTQGKIIEYNGILWDISKLKQVENELRQLTDRFENIGNYLSDQLVFFSVNQSGQLSFASEGIARISRYSRAGAAGLSWRKLFDLDAAAKTKVLQMHRRLLSGEVKDVNYEIDFRYPSGLPGSLSIYEYLRHDAERGKIFFEGVTLDITERKASERDLQNLHQAINKAQVSVVITDQKGKILFVNPFFTQITGYRAQDALGANPRVLKSGKHPQDFYRDLWQTISRGETWRGEMINRKRDGTLFWEAVTISPIFDGQDRIRAYVAVKQDISDRKEVERLKDDVDRIMRHDLKTPLNGIMGIPQLLEMSENLTADERQYVRAIRETGKRMLQMIDSSLDLYKMETGTYEYLPQKIDALKVINDIRHDSQSRLSATETSLKLIINGASQAESFMVWADAELLYSMLANLVTNAIEAAPGGAVIELEACGDLDQPRICITNPGTVPEVLREDFFQKYKSVGKRKGTGLGTYSAKVIADTMHLSLAMTTSEKDNQTTITIDWPSFENLKKMVIS